MSRNSLTLLATTVAILALGAGASVARADGPSPLDTGATPNLRLV